jgi:ribosomal protein S27E
MVSKEQKEKNLIAFQQTLAAMAGNFPGKIELRATYSLDSITPENSKWYFSIKCPKCKNVTPIVPDASNGKRGNPFSGTGKISVECFYCSNHLLASAAEISTFQWSSP